MDDFSKTPPAPSEPEPIDVQPEPPQPVQPADSLLDSIEPAEPPVDSQPEPIEPVQMADTQAEPSQSVQMTDSSPEATQPVQSDDTWSRALLPGLVVAFTFILGLLIGFMGRPVVLKDLPIEVVVTVVADPAGQAVAQANAPDSTSSSPAESAPAAGAPSSAAPADSSPVEAPQESEGTTLPTPTIMDFVLSDARHFQGDDNAPVTIVEFSDFK